MQRVEIGSGSKTEDVLSCETRMEQGAKSQQGGSDERGICSAAD